MRGVFHGQWRGTGDRHHDARLSAHCSRGVSDSEALDEQQVHTAGTLTALSETRQGTMSQSLCSMTYVSSANYL